MRKIDADAAIDRMKGTYCKGCDNDYGCRCEACWVDDAIGEIEETPTLRDWIPCSERLPEKDGDYLCISNNEYKILPYRNGEFYCVCFDAVLRCCNSSVTRWMPIPAKPEVFSNVE